MSFIEYRKGPLIRSEISFRLQMKKSTDKIITLRYQSGGAGGEEGDCASSGLSNEANQDGVAPGRKTSSTAGGAAIGPTSKTISAPTSPLKEKKGAGFFGKVSDKLRCSINFATSVTW